MVAVEFVVTGENGAKFVFKALTPYQQLKRTRSLLQVRDVSRVERTRGAAALQLVIYAA